LTLHLTMPVGPTVTLGEYRSIRIPWQEPQVTDDDLDQALLRLQKEQTEWKPDQRPAALGDQVVLDIKAKVNDETVLDNTSREIVLAADSPYPVPGFADQVVGMAAGDTREFTLTYPQDHYNADIAGKEAKFEVRLNEIRVAVLPLLDDEFAMAVGDYENLDDLKTKLRASQEEETRRKAEDEYEEQIWEKLLATAGTDYPDVLLNRELDMLKEQLERQLKQQGMELASYFQLTKTTEAAWREQIRPQAELRLKRRLILTEVIADQGLQVSTEEIDAEIERTVEPMGDRAAEARQSLTAPMGRLAIADSLITRKAIQRLMAIARGEQVDEPAQAEPPAGEEAAPVEDIAEVAAVGSNEASPDATETPAEPAESATEALPSVETTTSGSADVSPAAGELTASGE
jgi:trigger factor